MNPIARARRVRLGGALFAASVLCLAPCAAFASDVAPTPAGAQKLGAAFSTYLGNSPGGVSVTSAGDHYVVTVDLAKLFAPLVGPGVVINAAPTVFSVIEQSDGVWRVARADDPTIAVNAPGKQFALAVGGHKFTGLFDPAIAGFRQAQSSADKTTFKLDTPTLAETGSTGAVLATVNAAAAPAGLSGSVHETIADLTFSATRKPPAGAASPSPFKAHVASVTFDAQGEDVRSHQLLALWAFLVAHPGRAALAANEDAFKTLLRAALPVAGKAGESIAMKTIAIDSPRGPIALDSATIRYAAPAVPGKGEHEIHIALTGISPPPNVLPPGVSGLTPTAIDIGLKYSGYDTPAAAAEAINDMHLAGEGPAISPADHAKISAKLRDAGPIVFELLPTHIVAPDADLTLEGKFQIVGSRPVGSLTVHARNFDKTIAAVEHAGPPLATPQAIGGLAMAKGIAKTGADGTLTWVAEYGADGAIKVNGLPLGKAKLP